LVIRYRRKHSTPPTPQAKDGGELAGVKSGSAG
jgi:hypothetical protein